MTTSTNIHFGDAGVACSGGLESILPGGIHSASALSCAGRGVQDRNNRPWAPYGANLPVSAVFNLPVSAAFGVTLSGLAVSAVSGMVAGRTSASGMAVRVVGMMQPR